MEELVCKPILFELQSLIEKSEAAVSDYCEVGNDTLTCIKFSDWKNQDLTRVERLLLLRMLVRLEQILVAYTNISEYFGLKIHNNL